MLPLEIPYLPALDQENAVDNIINTLDEYGCRRSLEHVNWTEYPYRPLTTFTCAHSGTHIYIDFFVRCNFLRAENYTNQSPVSEDSCVEFFVEPRPDGPYWNFEFNCIGAINASCRTERHNPTRLTPRPTRPNKSISIVRNAPLQGTRRAILVEPPRCHPTLLDRHRIQGLVHTHARQLIQVRLRNIPPALPLLGSHPHRRPRFPPPRILRPHHPFLTRGKGRSRPV